MQKKIERENKSRFNKNFYKKVLTNKEGVTII